MEAILELNKNTSKIGGVNVGFIDRVIKKWNQPNFRPDRMGEVKEKAISADKEIEGKLKRQKNLREKIKEDKFEASSDEASWDKPSPPTEDQVKQMMADLEDREPQDYKAIAEYLADPAQTLQEVPRDMLLALLNKQEIREEVAYKILGSHVRQNDEFNEKNPTVIPFETNIFDVKKALQENMDLTSFK